MKKAKSQILKIVSYVIIFLSGSVYMGCVAENIKDPDKELYEEIELLSSAITIVQSDYIEEIKPKKLVYGALEGLLSSLDGYSLFMDPDSVKEMEVDTKGEFGGLGIEIGMRDGILTVVAPIDGTPAEIAGLKAKDRIVEIDGEITRDIKITDAVKKMRGAPGTSVKLKVLRESENKILDFTITRSVIKIKSIKTAKMVDGKIGYIKLVEFQENTAQELQESLRGLEKDGMKSLILDLRNNPGGLLETAYEVSEKFLPKDTLVVSLKGRIPEQNKTYKSSGKNSLTDFPMVVLVNEGSASASEIVAGAIQDNKRGIILGAKTFGKGSVQTVIPLKDGSAVRLTTAAYYTPTGRSITDKGILPDVEVKLAEVKEKPMEKEEEVFEKVEEKVEEKEEPVYDNQLQAAIDMLRGILLYKERS